MSFVRLGKIIAAVVIATSVSISVSAQDAPPSDGVPQQAGYPPPAPQSAPQPSLTQAQLDQLVAPVALYDDSLLADILTASTYPLEVVEADRWLSDPANAALKGDDLTNALADQDWDPSVKALVPFPAVLKMLDGRLDWTERLGEAFIAQQGDVMDAVQRLRHRAQTAGTLKTSPQQTVASDGDDITISPPPTQVIYVPTYDPWCAYGAWPYPIFGPYYYAPWTGVCGPGAYGIYFDAGLLLPYAWWDWGYFDWRGRRLGIYRDRYDHFHPGREPVGNVWSHDPSHRGSVPYRDPRNVQQFRPTQNDRQSFRGFGSRSEGSTGYERASPVFQGYGSGSAVHTQSQRGVTSRGGFGGGARVGGSGGGVRGGGGGRGRP